MNAGRDTRRVGEYSDPAAASEPIRRVPVFAIVAMALLMMSVDSTIVATALHSLQHGLHTSINWAGWTITAYSLGFVLMLPISGRLSERYGHRLVFLGSVGAFTAASLLCGLAENIFVLIALRALQAAGGAGLTPSATGIVVDHFGAARDRAVSLFGSIFPIGAMIGPVFGGLFVTYWSWRGVFFVNVPIGIAVAVLTLCYVPRDTPRTKQTHFEMDAAGMTLLGGGLLAGMLAVSFLGEEQAQLWSPAFALALMVAIVALRIFVHHINRSASPFIAPRLIYGAGFGPVNLINMVYGGITTGAMVLIPLYATNRYGFDAFDSGALLIPQGAAAIVVSVAAALALRRTGYRLPLYIGGMSVATGMLLLAVSPVAGMPPYAWLAGAAFLIGAGRGALNPASRNAGLQLAPEHSSILAALRTASLQIGSISSVSIVTAILASSHDPSRTQAWVYAMVALLLVAALPLVSRVPEYHGSW
ncbi:MAG: MFS transporter [Burkholderiales bacterium]|nr:MFS transporter [Burkholderiales bacterium]